MNLPTNLDEELVSNKVARIIGTAILKNDKNYTDDMMELIESICLSVIDTYKDYYYVKGETELETAANFKRTDEICDIREELRAEQRLSLKEKMG